MDGISPPQHLDLRSEDLSGEWRRWQRAFSDYLLAIDLTATTKATERRKLALFRHAGGEDVRELYSQMEFMTAPDEDGNTAEIDEGATGRKLDDVIQRFHDYCNPRSGIVVSRYKFHSSSQNGDTIDVYLMKLRRLSEGCQFGNQKDSLIRDKLLFGLDDEKERERLMRETDEKLSLEYVIRSLRVAEKSGRLKLQKTLDDKPEEVGAINNFARKSDRDRSTSKAGRSKPRCDNCGKNHYKGQRCPAYGTQCKKCNRFNHWAQVCKQAKQVDETEGQDDAEEVYLGEVCDIAAVNPSTTDSWYANLKLHTAQLKGQSVRFKLDTGAALSVCGPNHCTGEIIPSDKKLFGPGNTPLNCIGRIRCKITAKRETMEEYIYIVPNQKTPLLSRKACDYLKLIQVDEEQCHIGSVHIDGKLFTGLGRVGREYSIKLKEKAIPYAIHVPRPISFPLRSKADTALDRMVQDGVIAKVGPNEPTMWCAPMVVVPKANREEVRIVSDFAELNTYIQREIHPMSTVDASLAMLDGGKVFSKIDANSGFWQIPLSEDSSYLTTFLTHKGRFRYLRLPQGLSSSPEIFSAEMNRILDGCEGVVIHMDDLLVYGKDQKQHDERLQAVLDKIARAGMTLNKEKCKFSASSVEFLGHLIDQQGIHAGPRLQGILDFPRPTDIHGIRSFLGMANQYAKFSSDLADITEPLRALLKGTWLWSEAQESAFLKVKSIFQNAPVLATYDVNRETIVTTDASKVGIGATLTQIQNDGTRRLVSAASRSLTDTEQRYATIEKESLGVCWAMEKFAPYILGMKNVMIETDHQPLVTLFGNMFLDRLPPRIQGFKLRLQRFQYTMKHIKGAMNITADALSRYTSAEPELSDTERINEIEQYVSQTINPNGSDSRLEKLRADQRQDETLSRVIRFTESEWPDYLSSEDTLLKPYSERKSLLTMNKGFLMLGTRLVIPLTQREQVLNDLHRGHLGITKCQSRARCSLWWPGMSKSIEQMVKDCAECRMHTNKQLEPLRPTETPDRPWQVLGTDLLHFKGQTYLLVIDYYSRYPELALMGNTDFSSKKVVTMLKSMFSRHGIPELVHSDNGPQYASREFADFSAQYGFQHVTSSPEYHRGNGAAEKGVQTVKRMLAKEHDPYLALLAYRSSPQFGLYSPAELLMGRKLRTTVVTHPDDLLPKQPDHARFMSSNDQYKARMKQNHDSNIKVRDLPTVQPGEDVWISDKQRSGTVVTASDKLTRKSVVDTKTGKLVRNRSDIVSLKPTAPIRRSARISKPNSSEGADEGSISDIGKCRYV